MSETKFTPGPWKITENTGWDEAWCDWHDVGPVSLMGGKANANSHLIAAAPDLYTALESILYEDSDKSEEARIIDRVKAAAVLAKARGEQS